jgi:hypothetical protein
MPKAKETEPKRERVVVQLEVKQARALLDEAERRWKSSGRKGRANVSEVVRELVDAWLARRK